MAYDYERSGKGNERYFKNCLSSLQDLEIYICLESHSVFVLGLG